MLLTTPYYRVPLGNAPTGPFLLPQSLKAPLCLRLPKMLPGQIADPAPGLLFLLLRGVKFIDGFVLL